MRLFNKYNKLVDFIEGIKLKHGISSLAIINLEDEVAMDILSAKLFKKYNSSTNSFLPEYIKKSINLRSDPRLLFPWAKSIFTMAIPFSLAPKLESFIPEAKESDFRGLIAGYATRVDYHIFGKQILNALALDVATYAKETFVNSCDEFKYEVCVDTLPISEKGLAEYSELGAIGRNSLLLTHDKGSGCFIAELFTNISFPDLKAKKVKSPCGSCSSCSMACATGALGQGTFKYNLCRSCLTMEKRGVLSLQERKLLGNWIFGCDDCVSCCPGSNLPSSFNADLEWLLLASSSEVKKVITSTPIEYAGVTLLRRNSLAVLGNINSSKSRLLIEKFSKLTGSMLLKQTSDDIL